VKRVLAVIVGLALALIGTVAVAAWLSSGTATATATATTVNQANAPTATRGAGSVGLTWAASTLANSAPVGGYRVVRHVGSSTSDLCTVTLPAALTCTDSAPTATAASYGVIATIGANWEGPESSLTPFTYDNVKPVTTANVSPAPNAAGWNKGPTNQVTVSLNASDSGSPNSGVDHVSYTVDAGSAVVVNASTTSFNVSGAGTHTVVYFAVDGAGNSEVSHTLTIKIDPSAPTTTVTRSVAPNGSGWNNTDVTLNFSAVDADASGVKSVTVDSTTTSGSTASKLVSAEGTTTVSYFATDVADNVEGSNTTTVKIDKTSPTGLSITPASSATWRNSGAVLLSASDALSGLASIEFKVDNAPSWTTYTAAFTLADGSHTVDYRATDLAGNTSTAPQATIMVDTVKPASTIANTTSMTWTISATDAAPSSGVSIEYWVDSDAHTTADGTTAVVSVSAGSHTIHWFAKDAAGNVQTEQNLDVNVTAADTSGPATTNLDPADGFDAINNNTNSVNSWVNKACATGKLCLTITDVAGVNASSISYYLRGTSGSNSGKCWTGSAFVTGTTCAVLMSYDSGTGRATSTNIPQSAMLDGAYSITYKAKDSLGNETVTTISLTIN
jgi:hypothetical protein